MSKAINILFLALGLLIFQSTTSLVLANSDSQGLCTPLFQSVSEVYLGIEGNVPNVKDDDWHKILLSLKERNLKYAEDSGLRIIVPADSIKETFMNHPDGLYAVLKISYGEREKFSIPLESDQLVVWVEAFRRGENGKIRIYKYKPKFVSFSPDVKPDYLVLSASMYGSLENFACDVLQGGMDLFCTNRRDFSKNKIVHRKNECRDMSEDEKKIFEFLEKNSVRGDKDK